MANTSEPDPADEGIGYAEAMFVSAHNDAGDTITQQDIDITREQMTIEDVSVSELLRTKERVLLKLVQERERLTNEIEFRTRREAEKDRILASRGRQLERSRRHHDEKNEKLASLEQEVELLRQERLSLLAHLAQEREARKALTRDNDDPETKQPGDVVNVLHQVIPIDPVRPRVVLSYEGEQIVIRVGGN